MTTRSATPDAVRLLSFEDESRLFMRLRATLAWETVRSMLTDARLRLTLVVVLSGLFWAALYGLFIRKNMASKNVVSVIINYSLSPKSQYEEMAYDCSEALKWVKDSIATYGGSPDRIFVMGHSAGGHLAALINNDPRFFKKVGILNPIKGVILNDGFGLDMLEYLNVAEKNKQTKSFLTTFSTDQNQWKTGSPMFYLENVQNPFLIFVGERTYPAIKLQSDRLYKVLTEAKKPAEITIIKRKKHKAMIAQMIFRNNQIYSMILTFMNKYR